MSNILMCCLFLGLIQVSSAFHLIAYFDQVDIRGNVSFHQVDMNSNLSISFDFEPNLREFQDIEFAITSQPSVYDQWCKNVGNVVHNLSSVHGYISHNSTFTDVNVKVMGKHSILGKTLVFYENGSAIACSTILPEETSVYATAKVASNKVAGFFNFLQYDTSEDTFIYAHIRDTANINIMKEYDVFISADTAMHSSCSPLKQIYNPLESSGNCTTEQESTCKIGALFSKHGKLVISNSTDGKLIGVDIKLPLKGDYSIISRYVVIRDNIGHAIIACGKINIAGPLEVTAKFDGDKHKGISGSLKFSQQSPYHFTKIATDLSGLNNKVSSYHVHRFPISDLKDPCSSASVGGHVNTWDVDIKSSPHPFHGTKDKYEVGDLSGRYGSLKDLANFTYTGKDANLPLYGLYTILGRSIVIHENSGARFVCTDIEPEKYKLKLSSTANFTSIKDSPLTGTVKSMQYIQPNDIVTRTITVVDLKVKDGTKDNIGHEWSIHEKPVSGNSCPNQGDVNNKLYNPINVQSDPLCSPTHPFQCQIGDLSGKLGKYDMSSGKSFFSDENLPMFGHLTTFGRSIVINKKNYSDVALACANIFPDVGRAVAKLSLNIEDKKLKNDKMQIHAMLMEAFEFPPSDKFRINSLVTSDIMDDDYKNCFRTEFRVIDTNKPAHASSYECVLNEIMNSTDKLKPYKKCVKSDDDDDDDDSAGILFTPSLFLLASSIFIASLF